ncbi:bacteriohemerythrin [Chitinivibrio alkaliphilus]|uniref:Hemerythrin n=1 Tax=Chitinivibrio alkaliphilus ACht1 TaxID=1313304 RepID=U7D3S3_9BACT|nr:bacteriohemerythrin [Chitinivibrio alkaliphilus]ERP31154.1 Hemerythrin [Chitinivibrio alkaliphilus ACht1]
MNPIEWNSTYSVGVAVLDQQHQRIINVINTLLTSSVDVSSEEISDTLDTMTRYAEEHFSYEERLLAENNYPGIEEQKEEHRKFIHKTVQFCMKTMVHKGSVPNEVRTYLTLWWNHHIRSSDMAYKEFLNNRGIY